MITFTSLSPSLPVDAEGDKQPSMKREILFRGKRKNLCEGTWITDSCIDCRPDGTIYIDGFEVDPETVGQFTGLVDKNGNKVFEGDIYQSSISFSQVFFKNGAFVGGKSIAVCGPLGWEYDGESDDLVEDNGDWFMVVGNIHDNPELLK